MVREIVVGLFVTIVGGAVLMVMQRCGEQRQAVPPHAAHTGPTSSPTLAAQQRSPQTTSEDVHSVPKPAPVDDEPGVTPRSRPTPLDSNRTRVGPALAEAPLESSEPSIAARSRVQHEPLATPVAETEDAAADVEVPAHLQPEVTDEYWAREVDSSMHGQGRITLDLQRRQLSAIAALEQGNWMEAQKLLAVQVETSLCCGDYLNYNLAVAKANGGDWEGAVEPLKTAAGFGDYDRSEYALGVAYAHLARWREAAEALRNVGIYGRHSHDAQRLLRYAEGKLKAEWSRSVK